MAKQITALSAQKRNPNRVNVYLDGEFAFGLARIVAAWLEVGQVLTPEKINQLQAEDAVEVALQRAIRFLGYRPRSTSEVEKNLEKHQTPEATIREVIEKLQRNGMLDDKKFARLWVENRSDFRPRGAFALRRELQQKGIRSSLIEEALAGIDEDALAYLAGQKKAAKLRSDDYQDFRKKMFGFLSRRGFDYGTIAGVTQKIWEERKIAE